MLQTQVEGLWKEITEVRAKGSTAERASVVQESCTDAVSLQQHLSTYQENQEQINRKLEQDIRGLKEHMVTHSQPEKDSSASKILLADTAMQAAIQEKLLARLQKQEEITQQIEHDLHALKEKMATRPQLENGSLVADITNKIQNNIGADALQQQVLDFQKKQDTVAQKLQQDIDFLQKQLGMNLRAPQDSANSSNGSLRAAFQQSLWVRQHQQEDLALRLEQDMKSLRGESFTQSQAELMRQALAARIDSLEQKQMESNVKAFYGCEPRIERVTERITERISIDPNSWPIKERRAQSLKDHDSNLQALVDDICASPKRGVGP